MKTQACGYIRVSSDGQAGDDKTGLERQRQAIRAFAKSRNLELVEIYEEPGVSGTLGEEARPVFRRMMVELLANGCRTVIVEAMDRFARKRAVQDLLLNTMMAHGISLITADTGECVTDGLLSGDPIRKFLVGFIGDLAELGKDINVCRMRKGRELKRAKNGRCEGRKRYGDTDKEGEILCQMIVWHDEHDATFRQIADRLNADHIPPRNGKLWHAATVRRILMRCAKQG